MKIKITLFVFTFLVFMASNLWAKEIVVLYSGQTHAMLYPCSCPIQQDGGLRRRATLVKRLKKKYPQALLLDCGSFTAGGLLDEYTQNTQLDMQRAQINFKVIELMGYDAVAVSPDEFNFGKDFFLKNARKINPAFLSANLDSDQVVPYIIKEAGGVKIGIIGLTGLAANQKSEGLKINEPKEIDVLVRRIKQEGVGVVIVLSTLGEQEDLKLISKVKGIDILFIGYHPAKEEIQNKVEETFLVRPPWQGRKLGKLTLEVKDGKLFNCKIDEIRLSDEIADDPVIGAVLPRCYSDNDCKKEGLTGSCQNPGELKANCLFAKPNKVNLVIISAKDCVVCNSEPILNFLKKEYPGLSVEYVYLPDVRAKELIKDLSVQTLPAYVLGKEVEKERNFDYFKNSLELKGDRYLLKPQVGGVAYFFQRQVKKGKFDLCFSLFEKYTEQLLTVTREFNPGLYFLAVEKGEGFDAQHGVSEVEEYLRGVCVQKYYPQKAWDYLICRSKNVSSSWWEDCLPGVDAQVVKTCARGPEGVKLLKENISFTKQLQIMTGPTYLLDNQQVFSSRGVPDKEELKKIIEER